MKKAEFLSELAKRLDGVPEGDANASLDYYAEMIDDRVEDGMTEDEAVAGIGDPAEIAKKIIADIPLKRLVKEKITRRRKTGGAKTALLAIGSPLWIVLCAVALVVAATLAIVVLAVLISLYAIEAALFGTAIGGAVYSTVLTVGGNIGAGIAMIGASALLVGLGILLHAFSVYLTRGTVKLSKRMFTGIKSRIVGRSEDE